MPKLGSIFYAVEGEGEPIILVHGSWGDHHAWDLVAPRLAKSFRVLRFDRRGHSESACEGPQGVKEDLADIEGLLRHLDAAPAHVIGSSFGAVLVLKLAAKSPELFRSLVIHEPPLVGLLGGPVLEGVRARMQGVIDLLRAEKNEEGAKLFVEAVGFGPGSWDALRAQERATYIRNARTWLDEVDDADTFTLDLDALARFDKPALLTFGGQSPPFFAPVIRRVHAAMPSSTLEEIPNVGHVPHLTRPEDWVKRVGEFLAGVGSAP